MSDKPANSLIQHVQVMLNVKDERNEHSDKKAEHYQKFKHHLGREQELTRQLNEEIESFEEFRIGGATTEKVKKVTKKGKK